MTPKPGQGVLIFIFSLYLCVCVCECSFFCRMPPETFTKLSPVTFCIFLSIILTPEVRQRHVAMATPGPMLRPPQHGATPLRSAPGGPPDSAHGAPGSSPALSGGMETPPQMRRSMSPYSPVLGTGQTRLTPTLHLNFNNNNYFLCLFLPF